jgi:hypothetical protein
MIGAERNFNCTLLYYQANPERDPALA